MCSRIKSQILSVAIYRVVDIGDASFDQLYLAVSMFFFKLGQPRPLFVYFRSFQTNNTIFTTNQCKKCHFHPVSGAGIRTHDLWNVSLLP